MIRFSNSVKYALQFLLFLDVDNEEYTDIQRAAISCNIPHKFLESIAVKLKKNGILKVKRGAGGGYKLARHPGEIFLSDVVRVLGKARHYNRQTEMDPILQVISETLDAASVEIWKIMQNSTLLSIQHRYYELTEKKLMYHI